MSFTPAKQKKEETLGIVKHGDVLEREFNFHKTFQTSGIFDFSINNIQVLLLNA